MGRIGNRRFSPDDGGGHKSNKNNRLHHDNHRHDSTADRGSMDQYRGRDRNMTPIEDHSGRIRRRRRPQSETRRRGREKGLDEYEFIDETRHNHHDDNRRHDRQNRRRRRPRSRERQSRRSHRTRCSSLSSSSSISSQDSHRRGSRRAKNRKRKRSNRGSRRNRSRSQTISEHESYREAHYYSRDHGHDSRSDHHHNHHHYHNRNPFNDWGDRYAPPAGVVSDDDDGYHHSEHQQYHNAVGSQNLERRQQSHNVSHRNRHNKSKSSTKNSSHKKQRKGSPQSSNKIQDDSVGHFQGRDGCVIADRYRILKEVGVGTFGRVVECLDIKRRRGRQNWEDGHHSSRDSERSHHQRQSHRSRRERERHQDNPNNIVAIKIVRNVKRYYDSAKIEADIIRDVNRNGRRGKTHCAVMYDTFSFDGHFCMVFECLGPSLYDFLKGQKYHPFPMQCVRDFARQLLETLEFLHSFGLIHTDLKPENILLLNGRQVPQRGGYSIPESTRIKVIDFGGATYDNEKKSSIVNTRQYRAPEVILGVGWSMPSDLWSIGCILAELYQGELLFATHDNIEHLALIERVIGPFPRKMLKRAKNKDIVDEAFDSSGLHRMDRVLPADKLSYVKRIAPLDSIIAYDEDAWFLSLLRRILIIDPEERATAQECLRQF